jgi:hypothetical protein
MVVGAMDRMWQGQAGGSGGAPGAADAALAAALADKAWAARRAVLLESSEGEDVYVQVTSKQMVGLYLSVWCRKSLARGVRGVQAISAATGWGGYLGNKGEGSGRSYARCCLVYLYQEGGAGCSQSGQMCF